MPEELKGEKAPNLDMTRFESSLVSPPKLELKPLPSHLEYAFLGANETLHVVISSSLEFEQTEKLIGVLKKNAEAIGWKLVDLKGITPAICTHKIPLEEWAKYVVQP